MKRYPINEISKITIMNGQAGKKERRKDSLFLTVILCHFNFVLHYNLACHLIILVQNSLILLANDMLYYSVMRHNVISTQMENGRRKTNQQGRNTLLKYWLSAAYSLLKYCQGIGWGLIGGNCRRHIPCVNNNHKIVLLLFLLFVWITNIIPPSLSLNLSLLSSIASNQIP